MEGWIKLHRQIIESPVFAHQTALKIWIWCLCKASHSSKSFPITTGKGETIVTVERGQFIFGRFKAEEELGINGSTVYKWMHKFSDEMDMINIESNSHYSIITILNFNDFQDIETDKVTTKEQPSNKQVTSKEQPSNTYKNDKNDKNDKNVYEDKLIFIGTESDIWFVDKSNLAYEPTIKVYHDGLDEYFDKYQNGFRFKSEFLKTIFWENHKNIMYDKGRAYMSKIFANINNGKIPSWIK